MNGDLTRVREKLIGSKDERAVSPVIGVILMVAITVILAAVIAAFVMDMGDSISQEANAGANIDVDEPGDEFLVTWTSEGNSDYINVTVEYDVEVDGEEDHEGAVGADIENVGSSESWDAEGLAESADGVENEFTTDENEGDDEIESISGTITVTGEIEGGATTVITTDTFGFESPGYYEET